VRLNSSARRILNSASAHQEHLRVLSLMFETCGGEMDLEQFVEMFGGLMGINDQEATSLFLKIDFDNDGGITWSEFSNYIIALDKSQDPAEQAKVLSHLVNANVPSDHEHYNTISAAALIGPNQWRTSDKYLTFSSDGPIHVWKGVDGNAQKLDHPFALEGPATFTLSACALVMYNMAAVASNDEKMRFFGFEPRFKLDLELATPGARAFAVHAFAAPLGPLQSMVSFFVWGDDSGRIHVLPEETLLSYRGTSAGSSVAQVKAKDIADAHPETAYTVSLFSGWVTALEFIPDIGLNGALAACSNDANVVIFDPLSRSASLRFEGHALAVKCLVWVRLYRSIASSGLDREIILWDPKSGHKTGRLLGHKSPVINLRYYENCDMLFSLDLRYQLHMWDTSKQQLVNVINTDAGDPFVTKHRFRSQCILLNEARGHLVICGKRPYVWKIREEERTAAGAVVHLRPSVAVLHNDFFSQLVSVDVSGLVNTWELEDGTQSASYRVSIGTPTDEQNKEEVTIAVLTPTKRCILLGFSNGRIISYNLQTGLPQNEFVTSASVRDRSSHPVTRAHFSAADEDAASGSGRHKEPSLFSTGHADGGFSCVWQWATTLDNAAFEILPLKKMILPAWRQDWGVDYAGGLDFRDGLLVCGRVDGHVLLWNTHTGFIKKDIDHIFWYIDVDGDGVLTYDEVARFLQEREGYTSEELELFFASADRDQSGEISKQEFKMALDRQAVRCALVCVFVHVCILREL
jgi:WD40 repeat protein